MGHFKNPAHNRLVIQLRRVEACAWSHWAKTRPSIEFDFPHGIMIDFPINPGKAKMIVLIIGI